MSALRALAIAAILAAAPAAWADGDTRVVLADADPELRRAIAATLAPWHVEVVVDVTAPVDASAAQLRADARTARFVVWREGGELVVFDRERGEAEHRAAPAGALDPVSAAAAALTVKTLMRLPAPSTEAPPMLEATAAAPLAPAVLRLEAALATRIARGLDTSSSGRLFGAALVRPSAATTLRFGLAGELGTATEVQRSGFKGTWRDFAVLGLVSWSAELPRWDIEPHVGVGVTRSRLDGTEGSTTHHERATLLLVRAGVAAHYRLADHVRIGGVLGADVVAGTPAYMKSSSGGKFFEVPPFALSIGVVTAIDLTQ